MECKERVAESKEREGGERRVEKSKEGLRRVKNVLGG